MKHSHRLCWNGLVFKALENLSGNRSQGIDIGLRPARFWKTLQIKKIFARLCYKMLFYEGNLAGLFMPCDRLLQMLHIMLK